MVAGHLAVTSAVNQMGMLKDLQTRLLHLLLKPYPPPPSPHTAQYLPPPHLPPIPIPPYLVHTYHMWLLNMKH